MAVTALRLWALSHGELGDVEMGGFWTLGLPGACKCFFPWDTGRSSSRVAGGHETLVLEILISPAIGWGQKPP